MFKRLNIYVKILVLVIAVGLFSGQASKYRRDYLVLDSVNAEMMALLPVTDDWRNYFVFQSIGDTSNIIASDFLLPERIITLVQDNNCDGTVDKVIEYSPDTKIYNTPQNPRTKFFTDFQTMKKDIISGKIFPGNYTHPMYSLDLLKHNLKKGTNVFPSDYGYTVKIPDPDKPTTLMGEYSFSKKDGKYDLVFMTYYYKSFKMNIYPEIFYSVYCKKSKDPYIAEIVESLYAMIK